MSNHIAWRFAEIAAWSVGLLLITLYFGWRVDGELERRQALAQFSARAENPQTEDGSLEKMVQPIAQINGAESLFASAPVDQQHWSAQRIRQFDSARSHPAPADGAAIAVLHIPRIELDVPIFSELTERNLNRGAALVAGTAAPGSDGNVAIAAHRDGYFRALQHVVPGDLVVVEARVRPRTYRITEISIVEPTDMWPLDATQVATLTLVTCYPFYLIGSAPQRYIVRAEVLL